MAQKNISSSVSEAEIQAAIEGLNVKDVQECIKNLQKVNYTAPSDKHSVLKPMPKNKQEALNEAKDRGFYKENLGWRLPRSFCITPRDLLLMGIYSSHRIQRSLTKSTIFLFGESGAGKSSLINHLFNLIGKNRLKIEVSDQQSCTKNVQEYILQTDFHEFGLKDATMSIIDVPGLIATESFEQDACNIHAVERFCRKHFNDGEKPNLIFIVLNINDSRYMGANSNLSKVMRSLKLLNIVDDLRPNVICVMTHVCQMTPPSWQTKPNDWFEKVCEKSNDVANILNQQFNDVPVVFIENKFEEYELTKKGSFTRLPVPQPEILQPEHLFLACFDKLKVNKDLLGKIMFNACFSNDNGANTITRKGKEAEPNSAENGLNDRESNILKQLHSSITNNSSASQFTKPKISEQEALINKRRNSQIISRPKTPHRRFTRAETVQHVSADEEGCFSLNSSSVTVVVVNKVNNEVNTKSLSSVKVGDKVVCWNVNRNKPVLSSIVGFADYNTTKWNDFLSITLDCGNCLRVTRNHIVMLADDRKARQAKWLRTGDYLLIRDWGHSTEDDKTSLKASRIVSIEIIQEKGFCAPITKQGNLFVNQVLVSCYASVKDLPLWHISSTNIEGHKVAHAAMLPARIIYSVTRKKYRRDKNVGSYMKWLSNRKLLRLLFCDNE